MKIAAAQIDCEVGDLSANVHKMREYCARARDNGAELIVFPEMADTGYVMDVIRTNAATWESGAVPELREMARTLSLAIVAGVSEREAERIYNAQVVIDPRGGVVAKYRKTHLFSPAPVEEDKCFTRGDCMGSFSLGDMRFGLSICYDLRFPEVYRHLAGEEAANVLLVSSAWPFPRVEHLRVLTLARAIENQTYVVLSNRVGTDDRVPFCGNSMIVDPYGVILAGASVDREELICAEVTPELVRAVRERAPYLEHRRRDLY